MKEICGKCAPRPCSCVAAKRGKMDHSIDALPYLAGVPARPFMRPELKRFGRSPIESIWQMLKLMVEEDNSR
jgi:hypothetical protein